MDFVELLKQNDVKVLLDRKVNADKDNILPDVR